MIHLKTLLAATAILAATVGAHAGSPLGDVIITGVGARASAGCDPASNGKPK
jgi:hypothetical protein